MLMNTCLFANIKTTASRSSSSLSIRVSSSRASDILSQSLLSTTKIRPKKHLKHRFKCFLGLKHRYTLFVWHLEIKHFLKF